MFHSKKNPVFVSGLLLFVFYCKTETPRNPWAVPPLREEERLFLAPLKTDDFDSKDLGGRHYPASNELRIDLFKPYIEDLEGGYLGAGTDQNFTFIVWAKSKYAWLMDFDYTICLINRIHILFFKTAATPEEYRDLWSRKNKQSSLELLKREWSSDPEWSSIKEAWEIAHRGKSDIPQRWNELDRTSQRFGLKTFIHSKEEYDYIRNMVLQGRIQILKGDINAEKSMRSIAERAARLNIPIRVVYLSNIEDYFSYTPGFRDNLLSLPTDEKGVVLRTMQNGTKEEYGAPEGEKIPVDYPLHYNVQSLENLQEWMLLPGHLHKGILMQFRTPVQKGLSVVKSGPVESLK
ncbi:hypothetical protein EHQ12_13400 [Leptospira gomenensis]|uniref:DUF7790 domain-containing protein n=1 Tax=Leptospira gomenensis TaxID=2484974 RepID=A0A5F1YPI9_9LEPT|nr:hypothetical protein [Leptospira gomenensis]TGK28084.1 hypothetical protein EHQ17_18565 [Leptospira gomenensis]TGK37060.1 hypothetical protein EHQ12_13400 [Leptospira gomenensis]TGK45696.1 hypothetical protein EHQ07_08410 [Leptospira gomenensis]TGK59635.1 hypothetical protein EHQ13_12620 [Leptospira gomenensis]